MVTAELDIVFDGFYEVVVRIQPLGNQKMMDGVERDGYCVVEAGG